MVVEAGDEDTEREGTEVVVEEPVEDSAAVAVTAYWFSFSVNWPLTSKGGRQWR